MKENKCTALVFMDPTTKEHDIIYPCTAYKDKTFEDCEYSERGLNKNCGLKACYTSRAQLAALEDELIKIEKAKHLGENETDQKKEG